MRCFYLILLSFLLALSGYKGSDAASDGQAPTPNPSEVHIPIELDNGRSSTAFIVTNLHAENIARAAAEFVMSHDIHEDGAVIQLREAAILAGMRQWARQKRTSRATSSCDSHRTKEGSVDSCPPPSSTMPEVPVMLHIGGGSVNSGRWTVVDVAGDFVDLRGGMGDLAALGVADGSVSAIYASHVLEHAHHPWGQLTPRVDQVLLSWRRALEPGGILCVSVPNAATVMSFYADLRLGADEEARKRREMRLMSFLFGGQLGEWDQHFMGFDTGLLLRLLREAGFCHAREIDFNFGIFSDTSSMQMLGTPLSVNAVAYACKEE